MVKKRRKKVEKKEPNKYYCPHCKEEIFPAKMLYDAGLGKVKEEQSTEEMRRRANIRWNRVKLYGA